MVELGQIADEAGVATPEPGSQQARQWSMWIADVLLQIRVRLGDIAELDPEVVDYVTRKAVAEKVKRPDSATQVDVAVDDGRVSRRYEKSSGQVTILPEWWAMLFPGKGDGGAFMVDLAPARSAVTWRDRPDLWLQWRWPMDGLYDRIDPEGL